MRARRGFTLTELLIALGILATLMAAAYGAVVQAIRFQSDQEAVTSLQAKLRRVMEVFTQDLRSAVFGGITNHPYPSGAESISFALVDGGAGYPALPHDSGSNNSFKRAAEVKVISLVASTADLGIRRGDTVLMVNANGQAVLLPVTNVNPVGGGPNRWHIVHAGCGNTIDYTPNTLVFRVVTLGFRYDPATRTLWEQRGGVERPLAFNLSHFRIEYVYRAPNGRDVVNPTGYDATGTPAIEFDGPGGTYTLRRLQVRLGAEKPSRGRVIERAYVGQVELASNSTYRVREVLSCR